MELDFDKCLNIEITEMKTILNQYNLYQRANVKDLTTELTQIKHTNINGFQVSMRTGFLHDKSGSAPITLFGDPCNKGNNEQSFQLTNISLSRYKSDRILKPTEVTKMAGVEMETLNNEGRQKSQIEVMTCKIVSVVLSTLATTYKCADCKYQVLLDKGFAACTIYCVVTIEIYSIKNDKVRCTGIDQNSKSKKHILTSIKLLQSVTKRSIQNGFKWLL